MSQADVKHGENRITCFNQRTEICHNRANTVHAQNHANIAIYNHFASKLCYDQINATTITTWREGEQDSTVDRTKSREGSEYVNTRWRFGPFAEKKRG